MKKVNRATVERAHRKAKAEIKAAADQAARDLAREIRAADEIGRIALEASVKHATARDTYLSDYRDGMRITDIAKKYGVSRQAVSSCVNERDDFMARQRERDRERRAPTVRGHKKCGACGELGHQSNSPEHHPENAA